MLPIQALRITSHPECILGCIIGHKDLLQSIRRGCVCHQLDLAAALQQRKKVSCFIYSTSNRKQAVVPQNEPLAIGTQGRRQPIALLLGEDDAAELGVDGQRVAIEVAHILIKHLELLVEGAPGLASLGVHVAGGVDVGPRLVHGAMNQKARGVGRPAPVAADDRAVVVQQDHVRRLQQAKMACKWVRPEPVRVLRVSYRDVPRHALREALSRKDAEGACHVFKEPRAVFFMVSEGWNSGETDALGYGLQGRLAFYILILSSNDLVLLILLELGRDC